MRANLMQTTNVIKCDTPPSHRLPPFPTGSGKSFIHISQKQFTGRYSIFSCIISYIYVPITEQKWQVIGTFSTSNYTYHFSLSTHPQSRWKNLPQRQIYMESIFHFGCFDLGLLNLWYLCLCCLDLIWPCDLGWFCDLGCLDPWRWLPWTLFILWPWLPWPWLPWSLTLVSLTFVHFVTLVGFCDLSYFRFYWAAILMYRMVENNDALLDYP